MTAPSMYMDSIFDHQTNTGPGQSGDPAMTDPGLAAIQATMQTVLHQDAGPSKANEIVAPNPPDQLEMIPQHEQMQLLAAALYGPDFPAITEGHQPEDWASWVRGRWDAHRGSVTTHLHAIERNRLGRFGTQWTSSRGPGSQWREPMKPADTTRAVYNMIGPALDQRLQISVDQRPGFNVEPTTYDPDDKRKAEARQLALEYQYDQQDMDDHRQVAEFWSQTDGVAFWQCGWDPDRGPWDERMGAVPNEKKPLGDLYTRTLRVEQVRVSANATKTDAPYYVIIREVIPSTEAAYRYGVAGVNPAGSTLSGMAGDSASDSGMTRWALGQTTIGEADRLRDQDTVERFTIYVDRQNDVLPDGLEMVVIGDQLVWGPGPLLFKMIPVIDVRDGSTDPSYYPRPQMEQWWDHQTRINALISAMYDSIRANKGGRFLARPGAITQETFIGGGTSILEVNGAIGSLDDVIKAVDSFSISGDITAALEMEIKAFENVSGYNDQSRGQISGDASGRAILAAREQLERIFAPGVQAKARALTKWAKIQLAGMAFGYDVPRDLGAVGNGRPDLARQLTREEFDGPADVKVDPETLMPMPRVYREFQLDNWLDRGLLTPQQYMRRQSTAMTRNIDTPDEDQDARAQRVADAIRLGQPVPEMRWQDNESIHQDVLERTIILRDDLKPQVIAAAQQRWSDLANQAMMKAGGMPPQPGAASPGAPGPIPTAPTPATQPLPASNPSIALPGASQQDDAAKQFEGMSAQ